MTLPEVGRDRRIWGYKLLDFLRVIHNEDGTIKDDYLAIIRDGLALDADLDDLILVVQGITQSLSDLSDVVDLKADDEDLTDHVADVANPHGVTATQVGLGNVNNTSDANKPVSTATQTALDLKATITALNLKADSTTVATHIADVANPHGVTKTQVGLSNVPNTDATARANHTGTQAISTVTNLQSSLDALALRPVTNKAANYTATTSDYTICVDATAGAVTITLPVAVIGQVFEIMKTDASANNVIVVGGGSDTISVPGIPTPAGIAIESQYAYGIVKCIAAGRWTLVSATGSIV